MLYLYTFNQKTMRQKYLTFFPLIGAVIVFMFIACNSKKKSNARADVMIHALSDPEMLNPVCASDAAASDINRFMFQNLIDIDPKTLEYIPVLAESRAKIEKTSDGKMKFSYRIRPEARWDNNSPVTAKDVDFTLKVMKNPKVNDPHIKTYLEHLVDFVYDETDPLKFTVVVDVTYILAEEISGGFIVLPEYFYDPKGLMKNYTVKQLSVEADKLSKDPAINEFASDFNSEKRMREKEYIGGSGPYKLSEWITGQRIVITRKERWWGDTIKGTNIFFEANAPKLTYKVINDMTSALVALKAGDIDLMHGIKPKDFSELLKSDKFKANYNAHTPLAMVYSYIGINIKRPKFSDRRTREALAHLLDINKMIQTVMYGYAQPTIGPINPSKTKMYNSEIKPFEYNLEKAKQLLAEAGWKDTNGDGTLDKIIDGKQTEFIIDYIYNAGNDTRKQTGLLLQEEARKVGITINVQQQEWSIFIDNTKKHNFDIYYGAWIGSPGLNDLKQIYHSESALNGGSNYTGFGTPQSDALIDSIRVEMDVEKRNGMYKRIQQIMHDEVASIFLFAQSERIAIHKRFTNAETSVLRPGTYEAAFMLADDAN